MSSTKNSIISEKALHYHKACKGKFEIHSRVAINSSEDLSLAYTPGVAAPCLEIKRDHMLSYQYTRRWNLIAVVTDGSAVLGLGDIGPEAGMPVMEGKCILFKEFGGIDAFPICINSKNVSDIVNTISLIAPSFGGINLEDISAPRCFEIESQLKSKCNIPIFHDDQHGTAVVTLAALINALKIVKKPMDNISIVINGSGAAGIAISRLLLKVGVKNIIICDTKGAIYNNRDNQLNFSKREIAKLTNLKQKRGVLQDIITGADVFIGVSGPNVVTIDMVKSMNKDPIIFAMANPVPEIMPDLANEGGARVVGTGRSDFANQINNVLAFPGIFRGALDVRAYEINENMKIAAANAIASLIPDQDLCPEYIVPDPLDKRTVTAVANSVADAARKSMVAQI